MEPIEAIQSFGNGLSGVCLGAVISIYVTIVFRRYCQFDDTRSELSYRMLEVESVVRDIDHNHYNPAQLWIAASDTIRAQIQPLYFRLATQGHQRAKAKVDKQLNQILDGLYAISDEIAKRPNTDPELVQVNGDRSFWVMINWGFYLHRHSETWTKRMMVIEPNWEYIFGWPRTTSNKEPEQGI